MVPLHVPARVVAIDPPAPLVGGIPRHISPTVAAIELGGENIVVLRLEARRGPRIAFQFSQGFLKGLQVDKRRDATLVHGAPAAEFADVFAVPEHPADASVMKRLAVPAPIALGVEGANQGVDGAVGGRVEVIDELHSPAFLLIYYKALVLRPIAVGRPSAVPLALQHVVRVSPLDLLGEVSRIVFVDAVENRLQKDALGRVGDVLGGRCDLDVPLPKDGTIA